MTTTDAENTTAPTYPDPVKHHWIMTVQTSDGRQGTNNGAINVTPGLHTHESTYLAVLKSMEQWIGTESFTVQFFSLAPNQL